MTGWFVTANDIKEWTATNKRRAEEILPLLVKKLVLASCKPKNIDFSSGDNVALGGWDGLLEIEEGNDFIPAGKSGWEVGTDLNVKEKADRDYDKRTKKPNPLTLDESTFVFVTSRLWTKKDSWVRNKKALGKWKDIKGVNAETLESWLERCLAVHRWFASVIGKRVGDLWDIEQAWNALANVTELVISPNLFLNSRKVEQDKLINELAGSASILRVKAQSKLEAYGFILASLKGQDQYAVRVLIVKNQAAWNWVMDFDQPLILIPDGFTPNVIGSAISNGHHVILATDSLDSAPATVTLNRMPRQERIAAIRSVGLPEDKATQVYSDTKGYLEPILRHDALRPRDRLPPQWISNARSDVLFAALLATEWNTDNDHDKEAMTSLSGIKYQDFEKIIIDISKEPDPPVRLVGNIWQVISKVDMWLHIAPRIARTHLDRFGVVVKLVLSDMDPSFDLPPDERYMASIKGAVPRYSGYIKSGLADSLALLAAYGNDYANQVGTERPSDLVGWWVRQLFEESVEAKVWYSLGRCLQSVAEAAPDEFLRALERAMDGDKPPITGLFLAEDDGVFGGCPHSDLLWALELISWDTRHLAKVCTCLARLSEIDPGGKYSNRPFNSLVDIFLGWINNTQATHQQRLQVLEKVLISQFPDIAWKLMVSLLNNNTRFTSGIHRPNYHEWAEGVNRAVLAHEYYKYINAIIRILLREVDHNPGERLLDLIDNLDLCNEEQQSAIIDCLAGIDVSALESLTRDKIIRKLRRHISRHREFFGANWAWPETLLVRLEGVYHQLELDDVAKRNAYLFDDHWPDLVEPIKRKGIDYEERNDLIASKRVEAIESIYKIQGMEGIVQLAAACNYPGMIGSAIFRSSFSERAVTDIIDWLGNNERLNLVAQFYIYARSAEDWDWAKTLLDSNQEWNLTKKVSLLLGLPTAGKTFELVECQDAAVQREYWCGLRHYFMPINEVAMAAYVARKLLENGRPLAAVDAVAQLLCGNNGADKLESSLVSDILIRIATDPSDIKRVSIQDVRHDILKAIKFLQDRAELPAEKIAWIEWAYLKVFRFESVTPRYLYEKVAHDPSFFVQLVIWTFRRDEGVDPEEDLAEEIVKQRAETAWELLDTISILPGSNGVSINSRELNEWVYQARKMLREAGRIKIGDDRIGSYLSRCPQGNDDIWPHEAVRSVIERVKSIELDEAIVVGRRNSRGVTSRSPFDGGEQERKLAASYLENARKIELTYPRTADILRDLAIRYERDASREDWEVELRE